MTTVITGGSGFIGGYALQKLLARGERVVNADIRPVGGEQEWYLGADAEKVENLQCDITSLSSMVETLRGADRVIHMAGLIWGDHRRLLDLNLNGTLNVLEAARLLGIRKVVTFSSIGVLAPAQYEPLDTRHPVLLPDEPPFNGFYSAAKIASEASAWAYTTTFGMDVTVVRPCTVYGFGEPPALRIRPMIIDALEGRPTRFPDGGRVGRSYTHAADVAEVAVLAAFHETPPGGDRIFFAGAEGPLVTQGEIAELVTELIPGADIEIADVLTPAQEREARYRRDVDISHTKEQLGFEAQFPTLRDGLIDSVERYRALLAQ